jgi:transposase-like protein
VRYPQGGGLTDAERAAREQVRLQAVTGFEAGEKNRELAAALRVSERSVERWRRQWREEGLAGVASKGSPGRSRLSDMQILTRGGVIDWPAPSSKSTQAPFGLGAARASPRSSACADAARAASPWRA